MAGYPTELQRNLRYGYREGATKREKPHPVATVSALILTCSLARDS